MRHYRFCLTLLSALSLSACEGVISAKPLFTPGVRALRPGLWAAIDPGCARPTDARFANWPECAKPLVVAGNAFLPRSESDPPIAFVLSDDDPAIFQLQIVAERKSEDRPSTSAPSDPPVYLYAIAQIDGGNPVTDVTLNFLPCPKHRVAGLIPPNAKPNEAGDKSCTALTPDAVRAVARLPKKELLPSTTKSSPTHMVWIAEAPLPTAK